MRRTIAALAALALLAAACTESSGPDTTATTEPRTTGSTSGRITAVAERFNPEDVRFVAALERFDRCETFLDYIKAEALARVGPYGLDGTGGYGFFAEDGGFDAVATTLAAAQESAPAARVEGVDYSGTNVQVLGVDEPDILKTDGNRILVVIDGFFSFVDVTGDEPRVTDRVKLGSGWNHRMFAVGDRALVFSSTGFEAVPRPLAESSRLRDAGSLTQIQEIDLSDPENLSIGRTMLVEGDLVAARAVGDTARVVVSTFPRNLPFVYPSGPAGEAKAEEVNREVIEESTAADWLPSYTLLDGADELESGLVPDCDSIHRPAEFAGFETLSVLTVDLGAPLARQRAATLVARGETVYASAESLYVATNVWVPQEVFGTSEVQRLTERFETALHKFDISGGEPAEYLASGSVRGHLLNQFSLNEHEGRLQVATTAGAPWVDDRSESFVSVFNQDGDRLVEIGRVGDLGRGERIFSARFIGETAYVVTFREVDPLYVVDLSDPTSPRVEGELKIPGFSTYLHPLGEGRLLGVGQDANELGQTLGAKVSLFDVSDPADPREMDVWTVPDSSTDVQWDHLAFLYWPPAQKAVLPLQAWSEGFYGAVVLDLSDGLAEEGRITHDEDEGEFGATVCDVLEPAELGLERFSVEENFQIQVCGPDDPGGAYGYYCEAFGSEEAVFILQDIAGVEPPAGLVGPDDVVQLCWPNFEGNPIMRSLVIGDDVWTLTRRSLQANALDDLATRYLVPLG